MEKTLGEIYTENLRLAHELAIVECQIYKMQLDQIEKELTELNNNIEIMKKNISHPYKLTML
jgi:phosphoenolpyruvate synthase/pyruvate phosphate dikinase